jgi:hypothetical protein
MSITVQEVTSETYHVCQACHACVVGTWRHDTWSAMLLCCLEATQVPISILPCARIMHCVVGTCDV